MENVLLKQSLRYLSGTTERINLKKIYTNNWKDERGVRREKVFCRDWPPHTLLSIKPEVYSNRMTIQLMPVTKKHKHIHLFRTWQSFLCKSYS
jgi:hypothetical protein